MAKGKVGAGAQKLKGIKCKAKRIEVFQKLKKEGDTQNRKDRKKRQKDAEALGDDAPDLKLQQKTLDNTREVDETIVGADDPDIAAEDSFDEFAGHFLQQLPPRTVVTTQATHSGPTLYLHHTRPAQANRRLRLAGLGRTLPPNPSLRSPPGRQREPCARLPPERCGTACAAGDDEHEPVKVHRGVPC